MLNSHVRLTLLAVFFITVLKCHSSSVAEDGIDIFLKAVEIQESNSTIFSGRGAYDLTKSIASKTKKEMQDECDQMIADFQRSFPTHPMSATIISNIPQAVEAKYSKDQKISGNFRFDYSKKGYQYVENQLIFDGNSQQPITVIEKRVLLQGTLQAEAAMLDTSISQVSVNNSVSTVADFHQFGRVRGATANLMVNVIAEKGMFIAREEIKKQINEVRGNNVNSKILEIVETDPFGDGSKSYTLESSVDGKVTQRYMVVPSLGYVCPKVQLYDFDSGNLVDEYLAREFVLHQRSGLYYPTIYIESRHDASSGKLIEKREYKINQKALFLNETMHPNEFSLDVSEGIKIVDFREGKNIQYTADASGVLSLAPGGLDLKKMPWLRKVGDLPMLQSQDRYLFLRL